MASTTSRSLRERVSHLSPRWRGGVRGLGVLVFWLAVWQVAALAVQQDLLLVGPGTVLVRLSELVLTAGFWGTVWYSFARIVAGFVAATVVGVLGAMLAARVRLVDALVTPLAGAIRTTPVVSFIILVLIWVDSARLAVVISFLMVVPIVYTNVLAGIRHRDQSLLEVARVFGVPFWRRLPAVDVPAVLPYLLTACQVGVGLAWKSGIAAEVIGLPQGSIGEQLYQAKIFLSTADLFAWTAVVVGISLLVEKLVVAALGAAQSRLARSGAGTRATASDEVVAPDPIAPDPEAIGGRLP